MSGTDERRFVVQRHDARTLHFDLRLEVDGVLVSWAVPRGPSLDPSDKRLAHRVGDHAMEHADFEGRIAGRYGTGTVVVWDTGTYENATVVDGEPVSAAVALERGHLKVVLHGSRLTGAFVLLHTRAGGDDANWILVKVDDHGADRERRVAETELASVLTGRTNEDLEED